MSSRHDERERNIRYNGHPPYCTCRECSREWHSSPKENTQDPIVHNPIQREHQDIYRSSYPKEVPVLPHWVKRMLQSRIFWIIVSLGILFAVVHSKAHIGWSIAAIAALGITSYFSFRAFIVAFVAFAIVSAKVSVPWGVGALAIGFLITILIMGHSSSSGSSDEYEIHGTITRVDK